MLQPRGFGVGKCLSTSSRSVVHAAVRNADGREVALKASRVLAAAGGSAQAHEKAALEAVRGEGIVAVLELLADESPPVLVLERLPGVALATWASASPPGIAQFLEVALGLAAGLARIHAARWLHCNITPANAMVEPGSLRTWWLDFALARPLGERTSAGARALRYHELEYVSPEQTGRMNRGVDVRSDLYSFGAVLYFALVGEPPFAQRDALGLMHAHMALLPRSPRDVRADVPEAVSCLVMKLLQKEPDDRYQTADALVADLRAFRVQLRERGAIDPAIPLGTAEAPDRPRFSSKLYEREPVIATLRQRYALSVRGQSQVVLMAGEPGTGKSALVDELRPQIAEHGGYWCVGKFDLSHDRPGGAWALALTSLAQQLLTGSDARLERFRQQLNEGVGNLGRTLVDLVPDLEFVLGAFPPLPKLPPRETLARQALALRRFIVAFATAEHPLLIFLDDLQWSDAASRELLEEIVALEREAHLMIFGAYRANEVGPDHPLTRCFESLAKRDAAVEIIALQPLSAAGTRQMLADVLERSLEDVAPLGALIERKTGNAPLFVRQFVELLHTQGLLRFQVGSGWIWEPAEVMAATIPEGAVAIMTVKLHRLPPEARATIELASCVGDHFDLEGLFERGSLDRDCLEKGLYTLCDLGLLSTHAAGFRFVHDRIREAAHALLGPGEQQRLHHEIARRLLERLPPPEQSARVLEIAEHLNQGLAVLPETMRSDALRINLEAGRSALTSGAVATAEGFLAVGRQLLREEDWSSPVDLGYQLLMASVESTLGIGRFDLTATLLDELERRDFPQLLKAAVAAKRIQLMALTCLPGEAAHYALSQLRRFGVRLPARPSLPRVALHLLWVQWRLRGERAQRALRRCPDPAPSWLASILLIGASAPMLARSSQGTLVLSVCWALRSNLRHGAVGGAAYTLGGIASFLQLAGAPRDAERLEEVALAHHDGAPEVHDARNLLSIHVITRPWRMARREALAPLPQVVRGLQEVGDVEHAYYTRFLGLLFRALAGDPVGATTARFEELCEAVRRSGHLYPEPRLCLRPYRILTRQDLTRRVLEQEIERSEQELAENPGSAEPFVRTLWLMVLCVLGEWELAREQGERMGERLFALVVMVHAADHTFYRGFAATAPGRARQRLARGERQVVRRSLRRVRGWARGGPDFVHMAQLLEAECARLAGKTRRARVLYERAAHRALQREFPYHAAIAYERTAEMFVELRRPLEAAPAIAQALSLYEEWGCTAKCRRLREDPRFQAILGQRAPRPGARRTEPLRQG